MAGAGDVSNPEPVSTLPTAGMKRGREEEEEHASLSGLVASSAKRIKIAQITVPG